MQAVLSRVHRIVVPPPDATEAADDQELTTIAISSPRPSSLPPALPCDVEATIARTVERLQFATLLTERKQAVRALHSLAQQLQLDEIQHGHKSTTLEPTVGEQALGLAAVPAVLDALVSDPRDTELMETLLEFLQSIVTRVPAAAVLVLTQPNGDVAAQWGMPTCLMLLQDPSPWIRGPAVSLVKALQEAAPGEFTKSVLQCKEGLRRLLEVVEDRREHIRDTALAVLGQLTGRDKNVQQFLAFEEGFARLFQIMEAEGLADSTGASLASSVVADCLHIVNNMLRDNLMTQTLFLEMTYLESHVPRLLTVLGSEEQQHKGEDAATLEQKRRVLRLGLQLVRILLAGLYEGVNDSMLDEMAQRDRARKNQELARIQSLVARQEVLMSALGELICCCNGTMMDVRLQALDLLLLVSERNGGAQMILVNLYAMPSGRNVLADLVGLDADIGRDDSPVSAAASALLDALFSDNEGARMAVLQHVQTPPPQAVSLEGYSTGRSSESSSIPFSAGRVLFDAFVINTESIVQCGDRDDARTLNLKLVTAWKASHRLTNLLLDSSYCKELALRVPANYTDPQARAVAGGLFLSRCVQLLRIAPDNKLSSVVQSIVFQAKLSVLILLIHWCHRCPKAVREIVGSVANLSVLMDVLSVQQISTSSRSAAETTQLRGLVALLLGCCLEFLRDEEEENIAEMASAAVTAAAPKGEMGLQMTRDQILQMTSNRVGLETFTNALVQFQQTAAILACARASATQSSRVLLTCRAEYDIIDVADADDVGGDLDDDGKARYLFMLYERAFTEFYRSIAEQIQKRVIAMYTDFCDGGSLRSADGDSIVSTPASAYQDLIRMQDKQIHDLQRQVEELKRREMDQGCQGDVSSTPLQIQGSFVRNQMAPLREQLEHESTGLEDKNNSILEPAIEMATRMDELALVSEQPGAERRQRKNEPIPVCSSAEDVQSASVSHEVLLAHLAKVQAELDAGREANQRSYIADATSQGATASHSVRNESEDGFVSAQCLKLLEELHVECERKDRELVECKQMLEALVKDQVHAKNENERLKAELAGALLKSAQVREVEGNEYEDVIDNLTADKARLESRVEELEVATRAVYETDQEVLHQRIQEMEQERRMTLPTLRETALLSNDTVNTRVSANEEPGEVVFDNHRSKELTPSQLEELDLLRARVLDLEMVAKEREGWVKNALIVQAQATESDDQARRDKERHDATVKELRDELARALIEKKDVECKAKAAVTELENEKAQLLFAKVELEKKLGSCHPVEDASQPRNDERLRTKRPFQESIDMENSNESTVEDLLILVASLEIQCTVYRESLMEARGEHAVAAAAELCRQRGAIFSV
uniref:Vesicle tethering protein Uso1/P115-like head domain-containing protein n=1 Tax=Peronospora matthiolae TaxID=2874970 RepID=A0AAV1TS70_9STRA